VTLSVSIVGVVVTALIPLALWRIDKRRAAREGRRNAVDILCKEIDLINLRSIVNSACPDFDFRESYRPALSHYGNSFDHDPSNVGLRAIIRGEFEFAETRMKSCWKSRLQLRQKLNELKGDIRSDLAAWESSSDYRKDISMLQKTDPEFYGYHIPWEVSLATRNGQHPRTARKVRAGIELIASSFMREYIMPTARRLMLKLRSLSAISVIVRIAARILSLVSTRFWRAVAQATQR